MRCDHIVTNKSARRGDEGRDPGVQPREREQPRLGAERGAGQGDRGTIEGQSLAAPITLLDKLKEDGKGLERRAVRPHRDMHGRAANKAPSAGAGTYGGGRGMAQIQVTEEYKKAVEAYEAAFGEKPPYCVKDPEYIMECVRRGEPSDHVPDPNACY